MSRTAHTRMERILYCGVAVAVVFASTVQGQDTGREGTPPASPQAQAQMGRGQMGMMMAERQKMMTEMNAGQKKLDDLVAKMNAATGQAKLDQMAAVVTELVAQRKAMQGMMMSMQGGMMKQMMQMMQPAQPGAAPPPAAPSPSSRPPAGHEEHHP